MTVERMTYGQAKANLRRYYLMLEIAGEFKLGRVTYWWPWVEALDRSPHPKRPRLPGAWTSWPRSQILNMHLRC